MSEKTLSSLAKIRTQLSDFKRHKLRYIFSRGLLIVILSLLALANVAFGLDMIFQLPPNGRIFLWSVFALVGLAGFLVFILVPMLKQTSEEVMAMEVGAKIEPIGDRIVDALQLSQILQQNRYQLSQSLAEASIQETAELSQNHDFKSTISFRPVWVLGKGALIGLVIFLLLGVFFPGSFSKTAKRFRYPAAQTLAEDRISFDIQPGNVKILDGSDLPITITAKGPLVETVTFLTKQIGDDWRRDILPATSNNTFFTKIERVRKGFQYQIQANGWPSEIYTVTVTERPLVTEIQLRFDFPEYTKLPPLTRELNNGEVVALKGTRVTVMARCNNPLARAALVFDDSLKVDLDIRNQMQMEGSFTVNRDGSYHVELQDLDGVANLSPLEYGIKMVADEIPLVRILEPGRDIDIGEDMQTYLLIAGLDDYGFTKLNLRYYSNRDSNVVTKSLATYRNQAIEITEEYNWNLIPLELLPEDVVTYWVELFDNDTISGPKKGVSATYTIRFPSLYEMYAEVDQEQTEQIQDMTEMLDEGRELRERLQELAREMQKDPEVDWQKEKEMEKAVEQQQKMMEEIQKMAESLDETLDKLDKNAEMNMEIMEKVQQIQEMVEEIASPELKEALKKMQEAIQSLDPNEIQEALRNMNMSQEEMLDRLDRTLGMLKQLQKEARMNAAVKKAEELLKRQEAIADSLNKGALENPEQCQKMGEEQEKIKRDTEQLMKDLDQLKEMMEDEPEVAEKLDDIQAQMQSDQVPQEMQELADLMRQSNPSGGQCQSKSQKMKAALTAMAQQMQNAQSMMQSQIQKELQAQMTRQTQELLTMSKRQESLTEQLDKNKNTPYNVDSEALAEEQNALKQSLERLTDQIFEMSKKAAAVKPDMMRKLGEAQQQMKNGMEQMIGNSPQQAVGACNQAMFALNDAARQMMTANSQSNSSSQGGGGQSMQQQMQAMGQQQMGLNAQTQSLFDQMGSQGLSLQARQQMARLAAEQKQIQKSMEELAREVQNRDDILGRLDDMAKEAENVVKDLENRQLDQRTIDRQKRIVSRLLDAQKSMRQRGHSKKRESRVAEDIRRRSPNELPADLFERKRALHEDLLRSSQGAIPVEYEGLIKSYFQSISNESK